MKDTYSLVRYIRGASVDFVLDEKGNIIDDRNPNAQNQGLIRTFRVSLDSAQYYKDQESMKKAKTEEIYKTFNLVIRRKPKENNFKAVLEVISILINFTTVGLLFTTRQSEIS